MTAHVRGPLQARPRHIAWSFFREFHQLGNPERDRRKGLGLGLAIARRLAVSLDHPFSLSSTEGRGSVFRILVPCAAEKTIEGGPPPDLPAPGGLGVRASWSSKTT